MKLQEAYKVMELSEGATPEEVKKQYRKLSKIWHPDVNKSPDAEATFKRINESYQCIQNGKGNDRQEMDFRGWNPFNHQQVLQLENVELYLTITFKESVLGCKKEIKYSRQSKCQECNGDGEIRLDNGCKKCNGRGQTTFKQRGMVFTSTCTECFGKKNTVVCSSCKGEGAVQADVSVDISIPAGIMDGNVLRLQGMGNYAGSFMIFTDRYSDAFCHISVISEPGLSLEGQDVVFTTTISLLDALRGSTCTVKTIFGEKEIQVKPQSRNCDEVIIPHCGVGGVGNQRVILDVKYPEDINNLIDILVNEET